MVTVLLVGLADESATFLPSGALESFRSDLTLTYAQAGAVLASIGPGALLGSLFAAGADRFSRRAISAGGALGLAISLAAFASGGSLPVLVAAAFVMGCASTAMFDAAHVALVEMVDDSGADLRRCLARSNLLATVGDVLGPAVLAAAAAGGLSWRVPFFAVAAAMALYAAALALAPLPSPPRPTPPSGASRQAGATRAHRRMAGTLVGVICDPAVWVLGLVGLLLTPFDEPLVGFTIALLEDRGASAAAATAVAVVGVAGGFVAFTGVAARVEHTSDGRLLAGGAALMTAGAGVIATVAHVVVVAAAAFVVSVGLCVTWLALQHRSLTLRPGQVGATSAVLSAIDFLGFWIPWAIGAVADQRGLAVAVGSYVVLGCTLVALARTSAHLRTPGRR